MALLGTFASFQAIDDLIGAPTPYSAETVGLEGESLDLVGARGDELTFYLADTSVKGLWAAPSGLRLAVGNDDTGFSTSPETIAPKQKDWEDPVFWSSQPGFRDPGEFEIRGSFAVPDAPGPETQTLIGILEGEFLYPGKTEDGMHFSTESLELEIPATVAVVSAAEGERLASDFRALRWRRIALGALYAIIAFGFVISYGMWRDREQTRRWEPYLTLLAGVAVWASLAGLWLEPFGG